MIKVVLFVLLLMNVIKVKSEEKCTSDCVCHNYAPSGACYNYIRVFKCSNSFTQIDEISGFHNYNYGRQCYERILIAHSNISTISSNTFNQHRDITFLDMTHNHIKAFFPEAFHDMNKLQTLNISKNEISAIRRRTFNSLEQLLILRLDENKISEIEPHSFLGCSRLTEVHLEKNNISEFPVNIFEGLPKLSYLNASENSLTRFPSLKDLRMIDLDLSNNHIGQLEDWDFSWIGNLSVSNNYLHEMLEIRPENVQLLMDHNNITSLKSSASNQTKYNLTVLDLSYNSIGFISRDYFHFLSNLEQLSLQHNEIDKIDIDLFKSLSLLTYLDLSSNQIEKFQRGTFAALHNLQILNISNNRLVEIHFDLSFGKLQKFYFDNNRISSFDVAAIHQQSMLLQEISLNNNQWSCKGLMQMCLQLRNFNVTVLKGQSFNVENVYGIACKEELSGNPKNPPSNQDAIDQLMSGISGKFKGTLNTAFENSEFFKYFQEDYKRSNFFKYLDSYKFVVEHPEINQNGSEKSGFSALHLTPLPEEKDQKLLILIFVVMIGMFCCLSILIYLKLQKYKKRQVRTNDVENLNSISQMELCEQ